MYEQKIVERSPPVVVLRGQWWCNDERCCVVVFIGLSCRCRAKNGINCVGVEESMRAMTWPVDWSWGGVTWGYVLIAPSNL